MSAMDAVYVKTAVVSVACEEDPWQETSVRGNRSSWSIRCGESGRGHENFLPYCVNYTNDGKFIEWYRCVTISLGRWTLFNQH